MLHVLNSTTSAPSAVSASEYPCRRRAPTTSSLSSTFIWQPTVSMKRRFMKAPHYNRASRAAAAAGLARAAPRRDSPRMKRLLSLLVLALFPLSGCTDGDGGGGSNDEVRRWSFEL